MLSLSWTGCTTVWQHQEEFTMNGGCWENFLLEMGLMFHYSRESENVWRHFCLTQCLTFSMCMWGGGAGMLEFLQCWDELFHWECQEHCWDLGPLGESLNSRYWVGSTSLLKRGQKILMTVDCAHHMIPDLAFGLKIHLHIQRFCKTLDKLT